MVRVTGARLITLRREEEDGAMIQVEGGGRVTQDRGGGKLIQKGGGGKQMTQEGGGGKVIVQKKERNGVNSQCKQKIHSLCLLLVLMLVESLV